MTPQQKLKHLVLTRYAEWTDASLPEITDETIDQVYDNLEAHDDGNLQDACNEVRCSGQATGLACEVSRHYESKAVAAQHPDGSWIGWTYFFGGGKHGRPEEMPWMEDAYEVHVVGERTIVERIFARKPD
jgi:hypothetical protein